MKFLRIILITSLIAFYSEAQESEAPPTNLDQLLELVKEGKSKEQAANKKREEEFKRARNNQARILQEEKDELRSMLREEMAANRSPSSPPTEIAGKKS